MENESVLGCERIEDVLCKQPYVKIPTGVTKLKTVLYKGYREAVTPFGCGICLHCRINQMRIWVARILLESQCHPDSVFVTLTYNDEKLPADGCLEKGELQKFIKRLRHKVKKFKYFAVGEYGNETYRPHYHLIIFGLSIIHENLINETWNKGFVKAGDLTEQSARYVCGYVADKMYDIEPEVNAAPEFMICSQGIGKRRINEIALEIRKSVHFDEKMDYKIKIGGKEVNIGRYLQKEFYEVLETDKLTIMEKIYERQESEIQKGLSNIVYYDGIIEADRSKKVSREKRHKIYGRKRKL